MTSKGILVASLVMFGGAVYGIHTEKMRVITKCRDARLFMDGGIDATIEAGGLNFHHTINIYRKHLQDEIPLGKIDVDYESPPGSVQDTYLGPHMKFALLKDRPETKYGIPARLEADVTAPEGQGGTGQQTIAVSLLCKKK